MSFNARKAIRRFCLDCQGGHALSVRVCADADCVLYSLRHGTGTEEALQGGGASAPPAAGALPQQLRGTAELKAGSIAPAPEGQGPGIAKSTPPGETISPGSLHSLLSVDRCPTPTRPSLPPDQGVTPEQVEAGPARLIRRFCLACAGNRQDVRACDAKASCALWSFRFGVSPATFKRVVVRRQLWRSRLSLPGLPR